VSKAKHDASFNRSSVQVTHAANSLDLADLHTLFVAVGSHVVDGEFQERSDGVLVAERTALDHDGQKVGLVAALAEGVLEGERVLREVVHENDVEQSIAVPVHNRYVLQPGLRGKEVVDLVFEFPLGLGRRVVRLRVHAYLDLPFSFPLARESGVEGKDVEASVQVEITHGSHAKFEIGRTEELLRGFLDGRLPVPSRGIVEGQLSSEAVLEVVHQTIAINICAVDVLGVLELVVTSVHVIKALCVLVVLVHHEPPLLKSPPPAITDAAVEAVLVASGKENNTVVWVVRDDRVDNVFFEARIHLPSGISFVDVDGRGRVRLSITHCVQEENVKLSVQVEVGELDRAPAACPVVVGQTTISTILLSSLERPDGVCGLSEVQLRREERAR